MKLFFKHLFRSIKKRPLQPIILTLTLMLAVVACCASLITKEYMKEESNGSQLAQYGNADISITLNATTKSRFMFVEDVEKILGESGKVSGTYELLLFMGEQQKTVFGIATEFDKIGNVFDLEFIEYGKVTDSTRGEVAFISKEFSEKENLSVGDKFTASTLGYDKTYTVQGISKTPYFSSYDVLVDISGVMRLLASDSLFVSSLGEKFKPCSTIFIDLEEDVSVTDAITLLRSDNGLSDKTFTSVDSFVINVSGVHGFKQVTSILVILSVGLSIAVVFCCLYIISAQRTAENYLFKIAGASPWQLNLLQYVEVFIYWFVGATISLIFIQPLLNFMCETIGYKYAVPRLLFLPTLKSFLITLFSALLTVTVFVLLPRKKKRVVSKAYLPLMALILTGISLIVLLLVNKNSKIICSVFVVVFFLTFVFTFVPVFFKKCMEKLDVLMAKRRSKQSRVAFVYSVKNVKNVKVLLNTCRLWAILVAVILTILVASVSATKTLDKTRRCFNGDYAILNVTESCYQSLQSVSSVETINKVYFGNCKLGKYNAQIISTTSPSALKDFVDVKSLPKGNELIVSKDLAGLAGLAVGDVVEVTIDEKNINLKVSYIANTVLRILVFDCANFGIDYNITTVIGQDGVPTTQLRKTISEAVALELATIVPIDDVLDNKVSIAEAYVINSYFILLIILVFAMVGLFNNLVESYKFRRQEFELYNLAGMKKNSIFKMKLFETLVILSFGLIVGIFASAIMLSILNEAVKYSGLRIIFAFFS